MRAAADRHAAETTVKAAAARVGCGLSLLCLRRQATDHQLSLLSPAVFANLKVFSVQNIVGLADELLLITRVEHL